MLSDVPQRLDRFNRRVRYRIERAVVELVDGHASGSPGSRWPEPMLLMVRETD
jgi:hypothetical protein